MLFRSAKHSNKEPRDRGLDGALALLQHRVNVLEPRASVGATHREAECDGPAKLSIKARIKTASGAMLVLNTSVRLTLSCRALQDDLVTESGMES